VTAPTESPIGSSQMQHHHQMQHSNSSNDSNSSIASSRKSSTGNSLIAQLLSPSPPAAPPIASPQTEGMASSGYGPSSNGVVHPGRKTSLQNPSTVQHHTRPHR
jgi:hypothetical protein